MNSFLTLLANGLNTVANIAAGVLFAPVAWIPGWISSTVIAIATGIVMLLVFKHTSHQAAIKRTRNRIKADLLALSLFRDEIGVVLRCQMSLLAGAVRLLAFSLVPTLVMLVPMTLLLGQLALWYQARPLQVGEETIVTVHLADYVSPDDVQLVTGSGTKLQIGPVRVPSKQLVCWTLEATAAGQHQLQFTTPGQVATKQIIVGTGYQRVSLKRPSWNLTEVLLHPSERPFPLDSPVKAIVVEFPKRSSWTSGTDWWLGYWFIVSMLTAFAARPLLGVNL